MLSPIDKIHQAFLQYKIEGNPINTLYDSIFIVIKNLIDNFELPYGSELPSTRKLAERLKVSRSTIIQVYELLKLGRLVYYHPGAVHKVAFQPSTSIGNQIPDDDGTYPQLSRAGQAFVDSMPFLESAIDEETAFRPGLPPLDIFPVNQWKILSNQYWRHVKDEELTYMASTVSPQLRKSLARYLNFTRGIKADPRQIIVVSGSLQSIYAISTLLINPGETVIHENPTFPNVISILRGMQCHVVAAGIDEEGININELNSVTTPQTKALLTVPSCHYPLGTKMSLQRRLEVLAWARQSNAVIIEDDYEHEVNNSEGFIPSLFSLDKEERTFFLGTFNRLLHPSIRIGYMVVPFRYLDAMESLLRHLHRFVPNSTQMVLSQFIDKNLLFKHIQHLLKIAHERKEYFIKTFTHYFGSEVPIIPFETNSLHLLAFLPATISDQKLIQHFREHHIAVHALSKTYVTTPSPQGLIFGYTPIKRTEMKNKIKLMHKAYQTFKKQYQ